MISDATADCIAWAENRLGGSVGPSIAATIWRRDARRAVLLWTDDDARASTVELHVAAAGRWMSREALQLMYFTPYTYLQRNAWIARVDINNSAARATLRRLGASEYEMLEIQTAYYVMHKDRWRWAL